MKLRGIEYGSVIGASGVDGYYGEGYPYHRYLRAVFPSGFRKDGMTHGAKTFTLKHNNGNMPLRGDGVTPVEFKPQCIYMNFRSWRRGAALNAVGLSNFGFEFYMESGRFMRLTEPFMLSFMAIGKDEETRLLEVDKYVKNLPRYLRSFKAPVAHQFNLSCPNVGLQPEKLIGEAAKVLDRASVLGVPNIPKINLTVPPVAVAEIANHPACDAICVSNTLPWGSLPERINWKDLFGCDESPLKRFGGGGLSGAPLLPLLIEWLEKARGLIKKPIIAGGGILGPRDVQLLSYTCASAISIGSISMLRPWRMASTIQAGNKLMKEGRNHLGKIRFKM